MFSKIDSRLLLGVKVQSDQKQSCIIRFKNNIDALSYIKKYKLKAYEYFYCTKSLVLDLNIHKLYESASLDGVEYISYNAKVCTMVDVARDIIGVPKVSLNPTFSIAIIDTGLYPHLDFLLNSKLNILDFVDLVSSKQTIYDDNGHGTFVASILAGSGMVSNNKYVGIDNNSNLIIIKALDQNGETNAVNILKAMQWVYENKDKYNIKVACMSFGSNLVDMNDPLIRGAEVLWDNGVVVVSACGNSGPDNFTIKSPSASSKIISVGALDDKRFNNKYSVARFEVANFSSRGPILGNYKPDIVVSGVDVVSACNYKINKKFYTTMSGTSVATPIVAGVVSHLLKKYPNHTPDQIKQILISNCVPITKDRNSEGYGWLDLHKLFNKN